MNIGEQMKKSAFSLLSGGEKTRVNLARILLRDCDILLLDEPTNHLDMASLEWLEKFIQEFLGTVVVISHDRVFLDKVITRIIEIDAGRANFYSGNYSFYVEERQRRFIRQSEQYERQRREIKRIEERAKWFVEQNRFTTKHHAILSRIDHMEKVEKPNTSGRLTSGFDSGGYASKVVVSFDAVSKRYGSKPILNNVSLSVFRNDCIALVGANDAEREGMRADALGINSIITNTFMRIQRKFEKSAQQFGLERKLENLANRTRKLKIAEWKRVVHQTLGINIMDDYYMGEFFSHALNQWTANNVGLIKTIPQDTLSRMRDIVQDGYLQGRSNTAIGNDIQEAYGIGRRHAQFIARDQMAKLNSNITQAQQRDAEVDEYVWSTPGDSRVRDSHAALNGKRFRWDDPPVVDEETGRRASVGEDYNCRCVGLPVFNLETLDLPWESDEIL